MGQGPHFVPVIKMATTHPDILRMIVQTLGGHVHTRTFPLQMNYKDAWCWEVRTFTTVRIALEYVQPYLIIKRPQAELLADFLVTVQRQPVESGGIRRLPEAVLIERTRLYTLMMQLNHRGRPLAETKCVRPATAGEAIVRPSEQSEEAIRKDVLPARVFVLSHN